MGRKIRLVEAVVDNPYFAPDHAESLGNLRRISVVVNVKESTVTTLSAQKLITPAQAAVAERFRRHWELVHSVKFTGALAHMTVGGGGGQPNFAEMQGNSRYELERAKTLLGEHGFRLVAMICGDGYAVREMTSSRRARETATDMLRIHLDQLAELWGFATRARK